MKTNKVKVKMKMTSIACLYSWWAGITRLSKKAFQLISLDNKGLKAQIIMIEYHLPYRLTLAELNTDENGRTYVDSQEFQWMLGCYFG